MRTGARACAPRAGTRAGIRQMQTYENEARRSEPKAENKAKQNSGRRDDTDTAAARSGSQPAPRKARQRDAAQHSAAQCSAAPQNKTHFFQVASPGVPEGEAYEDDKDEEEDDEDEEDEEEDEDDDDDDE